MAQETSEDNGFRLQEDAKVYGLEDRTFGFARAARTFVRQLPRPLCNVEDAKQLVRSSGSVGANFIEATEALGEKDYLFRIRISRKEAKEIRYWLRLLHVEDSDHEQQRQTLIKEAKELVLIFNSMVNKQRHD